MLNLQNYRKNHKVLLTWWTRWMDLLLSQQQDHVEILTWNIPILQMVRINSKLAYVWLLLECSDVYNVCIKYLGVYWIDPDCGSRGNAFQASCYFTLQETCIKSPNYNKSNNNEKVRQSTKHGSVGCWISWMLDQLLLLCDRNMLHGVPRENNINQLLQSLLF
jgi:hypothetical protein